MSFVLFLLLCFGFIWLWRRTNVKGSFAWRISTVKVDSLPNILTGTPGTTRVRTGILFNGQKYSGVEEMPAGVRQSYEQAMRVFVDSNRNGIPDFLETNGGASVVQRDLDAETLGDPVERLRRLREMRDSGLITEQEYETQQAETQSSIALKAEQCPNCGADLNLPDDRDTVRCMYCGTVLGPHSRVSQP
jgi:ribosomal protein S27AE